LSDTAPNFRNHLREWLDRFWKSRSRSHRTLGSEPPRFAQISTAITQSQPLYLATVQSPKPGPPLENPEGISSSSEGLARSAYPGTTVVAQQPLGTGMLARLHSHPGSLCAPGYPLQTPCKIPPSMLSSLVSQGNRGMSIRPSFDQIPSLSLRPTHLSASRTFPTCSFSEKGSKRQSPPLKTPLTPASPPPGSGFTPNRSKAAAPLQNPLGPNLRICGPWEPNLD
jgi:hypothetical protein